jgi:uncharacterized protein (TIGR03067 family)
MTRFCALALAVGLMAAVTVAADDKPALDPEKLVGDWTLVEGTKAGEKQEKADGTVTVAKDRITLKAGDMTFVFGYKLDPKATPPAIDLDLLEPEALKSSAKGIVKLADGKVSLCYHPMGGDRPKEFKSTKEDGNYLFVMKKKDAKKEEKK